MAYINSLPPCVTRAPCHPVSVLHCASPMQTRAAVTYARAGLVLLAFSLTSPALAQVRVDHGKHTRLQRFARDMGYGVLGGVAFAGVDGSRNEPPQWGGGGAGYEKRAASNIGEFVIQESVTEGLAAI